VCTKNHDRAGSRARNRPKMRGTLASVVNRLSGGTPGNIILSNTACIAVLAASKMPLIKFVFDVACRLKLQESGVHSVAVRTIFLED
jgi:hypothetical protein